MKNSDPIFWPGTQADHDLKQKRNQQYNDSINMIQTIWYQMDLDQRFTMGDQDIWGLIFPGVATYRRKVWNFNITNPAIQTISGYQRRNRKTSTVVPIFNKMQKTSDQLTKVLFHVLNTNGVYQIYSDCFEKGALTQGLGFCMSYLDKTKDPISGNIKKRYVDPKSCQFDPFFRKHDMSDCRWWETRQFFDKEEAALLYEDFYDEIMAIPTGTYRDDRFYYMPEVYQIQQQNLVGLDEYWYLSHREATYLVDKETEECQEWKGDDEQLRDIMRNKSQEGVEFRKLLAVDKRRKPTVRRAIILNDRIMVDEPNPYGMDRYPVVPCLGYFNPDTPYYAYKFRGVSRDMRDPQYLFNRLKVLDLDQVEAQQSGIKMEKGALVTPDDALNQGNGRVLVTQVGSFDKVDKLHIDPPSPVLLQMEEMLKGITEYISGVSQEMMGMEIDDKAGIISMIRQAASVTRLQPLFDQFDEFQRLDGDITIEMIQNCYTFGKARQILGEDPTPEFEQSLFFEYGCKVAPGVLTETQQQLEAHQLIYAKQELGIPVSGKRILSKMILQGKEELLQEIEQAEKQQAEQAQQMAQLQMQQLQVDNQTKMSYANSQNSLAQERMAKIKTDVAIAEDKLKHAHQEDTHSLLNLVKTLKELKGMDLEHMAQQLQILQMAEQGPSVTDEKKTPSVA